MQSFAVLPQAHQVLPSTQLVLKRRDHATPAKRGRACEASQRSEARGTELKGLPVKSKDSSPTSASSGSVVRQTHSPRTSAIPASNPSTIRHLVATAPGSPAGSLAGPPANTSGSNVASGKNRLIQGAWDAGFSFEAAELPGGTWLQVTEGALPSELEGTYFRNGPVRPARARMPPEHQQQQQHPREAAAPTAPPGLLRSHPWGGDGLMAAVTFCGDGRAAFRSAFVRTPERDAEKRAGRTLFRGPFSAAQQDGGGGWGGLAQLSSLADPLPRNPASLGVVAQGGRLLAMHPAGAPYALDLATLATQGPASLGGALRPGRPLSLGSPAADAAASHLLASFAALRNGTLLRGTAPAAAAAAQEQQQQVGGDGLAPRPRLCGATGRRLFWSHRTIAATGLGGEPVARGRDTGRSAAAAAAAAAGARNEDERGGSGGSANVEGPKEDVGAWLIAGLRWLLRPPAKRFTTELSFWEVDAGADPLQPSCPSGPAAQAHAAEQEAATAAAVAKAAAELAALGLQPVAEEAATSGAAGEAASGARRRVLRYRLPGFGLVTDVALSENYIALLQPPVHPEVLPYLLGASSAPGCLRWRQGEASLLHVVPRPGSQAERRGEQAVVLPLPPSCPAFVTHWVNAFEEQPHQADPQPQPAPGQRTGAGEAAADGSARAAGCVSGSTRLVLDCVAYEGLPAVVATGRPLPEQRQEGRPELDYRPRLVRLEVDLARHTVSATPGPVPAQGPAPAGAPAATPAGPASPSDHHFELPTINSAFAGRRHRYTYGCSAVFEAGCVGLMKVDMDTRQAQRWLPGPGYLCMEPTFVPRLPAGAAAAATATAARRPLGGKLGGGLGAALPAAVQGRQRSEDDGWLLVYGFDSAQRRSELLVFDAWALMAGPMARLELPKPLPLGLYGTWTDACGSVNHQ